METLEIRAAEIISVRDIVVEIGKFILRFMTYVNELTNLISPNPESAGRVDGRAPPTLGINVSEAVKTVDKFGPGR